MAQHRRCQGQYVIDRRRVAPVEQGARPACQHQGLAGARSRSPRHKAARPFGGLFRTARAYQRKDRVDDAVADRDLPHQPLRCLQLGGRHGGARRLLAEPGGGDQHQPLGIAIGVIDIDLQQKAVELSFR